MFFETEDVNEIIYVSDELRRDLMNTYIEPYYRKMIVDILSARTFYKKLGMIFETTSKLCIALSSIYHLLLVIQLIILNILLLHQDLLDVLVLD